MRRLDELFLAWPFFGSRRMTAMLRAEGQRINRKRVRRLMRLMGLTALGPKPQTSKPAPGHKIYPYLLRGLVIERANQVWAADITYVPIGRGFLYLVAIMDWGRSEQDPCEHVGAGDRFELGECDDHHRGVDHVDPRPRRQRRIHEHFRHRSLKRASSRSG